MYLRALLTSALLSATLGLTPTSAYAASADRTRAAMIYRLAQFVSWPSDQTAPEFRICVVGEDAVSEHLGAVAGKKVDSRTVVVDALKEPENSCQIVVMGDTEAELLNASGVLTVGVRRQFVADGGMVAFDIQKNRLVFDVNLEAARAQGLEISSQLLNLARSVQ